MNREFDGVGGGAAESCHKLPNTLWRKSVKIVLMIAVLPGQSQNRVPSAKAMLITTFRRSLEK